MPPIYRVKKRTKNGIFACHYAKTPQKEGEKYKLSNNRDT